jgi:hypothetical protein
VHPPSMGEVVVDRVGIAEPHLPMEAVPQAMTKIESYSLLPPGRQDLQRLSPRLTLAQLLEHLRSFPASLRQRFVASLGRPSHYQAELRKGCVYGHLKG